MSHVFLTAASCPKKDFYTPQKGIKKRQKGSKKAVKKARKAAKNFIPEPVLLLS